MATEVGVAFVRLLPSMQGFSSAAARGMTSGLTGAATAAGREGGRGFVSGFGDTLQAGGDRIASAGDTLTKSVTLPLAAVGVGAFRAASDFETATTKIVALAGVPREQMDGWEDDLRSLAKTYGVSGAEAADALFFIVSAGLEGEAAMDALDVSLKAAATGLGTVEEVALLATSAIAAYGPDVITAAEATDILTAAAAQAVFAPEEMSAALTTVIPLAAEMGVTFDEVSGIMAALAPSVNTASEAGTRIEAVMRAMLAPSSQAADILEGVGLSGEKLRDVISEDGLTGAIRVLDEALDSDTEAMSRVLGSSEALGGALGLLGRDASDVDGILDATANAAGALDDSFAEVSETSAFQMKQQMAELQDLLLDVGQTVIPIVMTVLQQMGAILQSAADAWAGLSPGVQETVVQVAAFAAILGPVLSITGRLIKVMGTAVNAAASLGRGLVKVGKGAASAARFAGRMVVGLGRAAVAFGRLSAAAAQAAARVVAAGARMAAQAAASAARVVAQIALQIARWVALAAAALASAASVAVAWLISMGPIILVGAAIAGLAALFVAHFDTIKGAVETAFRWVQRNWPTILAILTGPIGLAVLAIVRHWDTIQSAISDAVGTIKSVISAGWSFVTSRTRSAFNAARDAIVTPIRSAKSTIDRLVSNIKSFFAGIKSSISRAFSGLADTIKAPFVAAFDAIRSAWNNTIGGFTFPSISIPDIPGVPGRGQTIGGWTIPTMHTGGIVGGSGDQLIRAEAGEGIFTRGQMAALAPVGSAAPSPTSTRLVVDVTGGDADLVRLIAKWVRANGNGDVQVLAGAR